MVLTIIDLYSYLLPQMYSGIGVHILLNVSVALFISERRRRYLFSLIRQPVDVTNLHVCIHTSRMLLLFANKCIKELRHTTFQVSLLLP